MHVKAKQIAFLGLLAAVVSVCIVLSSVIETSTVFLLAAAAYLVGVAIREYGLRLGFGFFLACTFLGFVLSFNKLYAFTFGGFGLYIVWHETLYSLFSKGTYHRYKVILFYGAKLILFDILYIGVVLLLTPKLVYSGEMDQKVWIALVVAGQLGWWIYDWAYRYFQTKVWQPFRNKIFREDG